MKTSVKCAVWAGVITMISGAVIVAGAPREIAFLTLPSWPGFFLTFFLGVGPAIEGIPAPTNIAVHLLTFAVWWGIFWIGLRRWRRHRDQQPGARLP
jgi:hypothetical protein